MTLEKIIEAAERYELNRTKPDRLRQFLVPHVWKAKAQEPNRSVAKKIWCVFNWIGLSPIAVAEAIGFDWQNAKDSLPWTSPYAKGRVSLREVIGG